MGGGITAAVVINSSDDDEPVKKHKKNSESSSVTAVDDSEEEETTTTTTAQTTTTAAQVSEESKPDETKAPEQPQQPGELEIHTLDLTDGKYGSYYFINRDWESAEEKDEVDGFFLTEEHPVTIEQLNERYAPLYVYEENEAEYASVEEFAKGR